MTVKELIVKLSQCNLEADVNVIAHCKKYDFSMTYGGGDGCEKHNCDTVSFYVDKLCTNEKAQDEEGWHALTTDSLWEVNEDDVVSVASTYTDNSVNIGFMNTQKTTIKAKDNEPLYLIAGDVGNGNYAGSVYISSGNGGIENRDVYFGDPSHQGSYFYVDTEGVEPDISLIISSKGAGVLELNAGGSGVKFDGTNVEFINGLVKDNTLDYVVKYDPIWQRIFYADSSSLSVKSPNGSVWYFHVSNVGVLSVSTN